MYRLIFVNVFRLVTAAFVLCAIPSVAHANSPYVGVYKTNDPHESYVQVKKIDDEHFLYTHQGVGKLQIKQDGSYLIEDYYASGQFKDSDKGNYHQLSYSDFASTLHFERVEVNNTDNIETIHHGHINSIDVGHPNPNKCEQEFPFSQDQLNNDLFDSLWQDISDGEYGYINSVLIAQNGHLIAEKYFNGFNQNEKQTVQSVTKSLVSLMAGKAIADGYISSVESPIKNHLPAYKALFKGGKEQIQVKHLLEMRPGWQWDEWSTPYTNSNNPRTLQMSSKDTIKYVIERPLAYEPGKVFTYSGGAVDVMAEVVKNESPQKDAAKYFKKEFGEPLCLSNASWWLMQDKRIGAGGGLILRPRDMLKFGQLVLDKGEWLGVPILPKQWIVDSTQSKMYGKFASYAWYWWNEMSLSRGKRYPSIWAMGWGDQNIMVLDDLGLVVVTTGYNFERDTRGKNILDQHILPKLTRK